MALLVRCDKCEWTTSLENNRLNMEATIYMAAWSHVQTSHRELAEWISASLSIDERKSYLVGWSQSYCHDQA
jgi:hypothetical protein